MSTEDKRSFTPESIPEDGPEETNDNSPREPPKTIVEKKEEEKLKAKYPMLKGAKSGGHALLHKRLAKGPKYFDSGDYNMAKAKMNNPKKPLAANEKMYLQESIGETIPTADNLHLRKPSIVTSKLASDAIS
ncbi:cAMP-regulated phosphoprotein 19-like [Gigantopelta aegis]|uniref:cAMP-regulated phosphoprotein 19-like n=1 Tax=Gigantopelta aegis TaxID=1735272 RepID=UPI001B88D15D|nr:cAMP-regulated phosphoprotein 19-like [Gigantopelta aegis]